jgi:small subunit ribosomal protein S17
MRTTLQGIVTSDKCDKTRRVEVRRLYRHPKYGKIVRGRTVCHVHDEQNESHAGDTIEIVECRPRSRQKRWELVRIVERSKLVDRRKGSHEVVPDAAEASREPETAGGAQQ